MSSSWSWCKQSFFCFWLRSSNARYLLKDRGISSGWKVILYKWLKSLNWIKLIFRLCSKHRKSVSMIPEEASVGPITTYSNFTDGSEFVCHNSRDSTNRVLAQANLSPIRSQTRKRLDLHSDSGRRRIASTQTCTIRVIQRPVQTWRNHVFTLCYVNNSTSTSQVE